jgi:hypothetical protein
MADGYNFEMRPPKDHLGQIWFSSLRGEEFSHENPEYMLNYSLPCSWQLIFALILIYNKAAMDN